MAVDTGRKLSAQLGRSLLLIGELRAIGAALKSAGIDHIVLKGVPLAVRLTGQIHGRARRIRDNDILVRRKDLRAAVQALQSLDYLPTANVSLESQLVVNFEYEMYRELPGGTTITAEIHWAPFPPQLYPVAEAYLWSRTELVEVGGQLVRVLDPTLTILQLASHFVQHAGSVEWILRDLAMAWRKWGSQLDVEDLRESAERTGLTHVLAFSLSAARDLRLLDDFPRALESRRARALRRVLPTSRLGPPQIANLRRSLELLALAPPRQVPGWLWLRVAPPREAMAARYRLSPNSGRIYLQYALRPLIFARDQLGKIARSHWTRD